MNKAEIRERLTAASEEDYRAFHMKLQPSKSEVLGVRAGTLRKLAKEISKDGWKEYAENVEEPDYYEEKLIAGMSIFYAKADIDEKIEYADKIITFIDGWAVCDGICATIKLDENEKDRFFSFAEECAASGEEFRARFGIISIRQCFIDEEHIDDILNIIDGIEYAGYYDKMGAAWLLADCMVKLPDKTYEYMKNNSLDDWVYNKSITKMRESYRISPEMKAELKTMMRKQ
ncbi:MAG: DNA alkylation repair protein [Clostridiales bacterium]|nr:DNA alkylation repair protein [Clostridiales bacterium]